MCFFLRIFFRRFLTTDDIDSPSLTGPFRTLHTDSWFLLPILFGLLFGSPSAPLRALFRPYSGPKSSRTVTLPITWPSVVIRTVPSSRPRAGSDTEDTIRHRLAVYEESTRPLLDFYRDRGVLLEIDGTGDVDEVTRRIRDALDPLVARG